MNKTRAALLLVGAFCTNAFASGLQGQSDPVTAVIFWVSVLLFFGICGRLIALKLHQPQVLGELVMGIIIGNLAHYFGLELALILREGSSIFTIMRDLLSGIRLPVAVQHAHFDSSATAAEVLKVLSGMHGVELIKVGYVIDIFSRLGVIFLLFMVGLESSINELKRTGRESFFVALIGVIAPIMLSLLISHYLLPTAPSNTHLFIAATLCATSVGITASVLKELKKLRTREAQIILGAAVADDILGLIILAIVSSIVVSQVVSISLIGKVFIDALLFFIGSFLLGPFLLKKAVVFFKFLDPWEAKLCIAFLFVMLLSWLASLVHLAPMIGAFAAGIIIHDGYFKTSDLSIKELMGPLEALLAPLFFVLIGIQVKLEVFMDWHVLYFACGILIAAVLGKLMSGFGAGRQDDRWLIGVGMLPRGEVGLIFASIGKTLGVLSENVFSALILMIIVTTMIAPSWLKQRYAAHES